jgi:large subunit ribosomal protein L4
MEHVDKSTSEKVEAKSAIWQAVSVDEMQDVKVRPQVLREVILGMQANLHQSNANTKRRGEVRGGGKKPWRQKGTGRARTGSSRNPLWRGGGITFGPLKIKNYQQKFTATLRRQALAGALRLKIQQGKVVVWNTTPPTIKTNAAVKQAPQLIMVSPTLVVVPSLDYKIGLRNLPNVNMTTLSALNALDVASARQIVFIGDTFAGAKAKLTA